ncbi:ryncolin-1 isoform X2 [Exaiptasia diaphana]|uniref:Uncharacterized protein n=1 Tax=Exaiptasia diaphana TaxID=2652724 RepID=A0A913YHK7_EXADI|nr:ryncolin-1 isoform X2 [Exaiptasia diaphana]
MLVNHVIETLNIGDIDSCFRTCAAKPGCQSINFYREKSLCELNSRTIENTPNMRVANEDSVYFTIPDPIPPEPVDGNFTEWSNWTSCSLLCGNGTRHRNRSCTNPPPAHGGKNCSGSHNETETCNAQPCSVLKNCAEFYRSGFKRSGVYVIDPDGDGKFNVSCDQKTAGGGWTVFQKRQDGSVDFYRGWNDYKNGFGDLNGEFWLGLDKIHRLTKERKQRLRVDLEDTKGKTAYAEYDNFAVANEQDNYRMSFKSYSVEPPLNGHLGERPEVYR